MFQEIEKLIQLNFYLLPLDALFVVVLTWLFIKFFLIFLFRIKVKIKNKKISLENLIKNTTLFFYSLYFLINALIFKFLFKGFLFEIVSKIFFSIFIFFFSIYFYKIIERIIDNRFKHYNEDIQSFIIFLKSFFKFFALVIAFFQILLIWNVNITPLLASAGIFGIALALGAQQLLSNFFGGINLFLDKSIKVGDKVVYEGKVLWVEEINIRTTKFRTLENTFLIVPNSKLANSVIENITQPKEPKNVRIQIDVAYGSDINKVKKILLKVARKNSKIVDENIDIYFYELGEYSLKFLVIFKVANDKDMWPARCEFIEEVYKEFQRENIEIPFPTRNIFIRELKKQIEKN